VVKREYHAGLTSIKVPNPPEGPHLQRSKQDSPEGAPMKIACVLGQGFEDSEFRIPYDRLRQEGYQVDVIGLKAGEEMRGYRGKETVKVEKAIDQVRADDYDALLIPVASRRTTCASTSGWSTSSGSSSRPASWSRRSATGRSSSSPPGW